MFGIAIIIAVYLPIFTLEGLEGRMFRPMAITVCSAILGSLLLALTVVPAAAAFLFRKPHKPHRERLFAVVHRGYVRLLETVLRHRLAVITAAAVVVVAALASLAYIGTEFMPRLDEGSILIETRKLPSVSLTESVAISTEVERIVRALPRGPQRGHQAGPPGPGHRSHGHLPGRRLRHAGAAVGMEDRSDQGAADRGHVRRAGQVPRRDLQFHPAHGHAAGRSRLRE